MKEEYFIYLGVFAVILIMLILNSYVFNKIRMTEGLETMDTNSSKEDSTSKLAGNAVKHLEKLKASNEALGNKLLLDHPEYTDTYGLMIVELDKYRDNQSVLLATDIDLSASDAVIIKKLADLNTLTQSKVALNSIAEYLSKH